MEEIETGAPCLCGECVVNCTECSFLFGNGEKKCNDFCCFSEGTPPSSLTLIYNNVTSLSSIDVTFKPKDCEETYNSTTDGVPSQFFVKRIECLSNQNTLGSTIRITTDNDDELIHTSCSEPLYIGKQYGNFTIVGYCMKAPNNGDPAVCSGVYGGNQTDDIACKVLPSEPINTAVSETKMKLAVSSFCIAMSTYGLYFPCNKTS